MERKNEEFARKLLALEKEYGLKIVADDPFCGRGILNKVTGEFDEDTLYYLEAE